MYSIDVIVLLFIKVKNLGLVWWDLILVYQPENLAGASFYHNPRGRCLESKFHVACLKMRWNLVEVCILDIAYVVGFRRGLHWRSKIKITLLWKDLLVNKIILDPMTKAGAKSVEKIMKLRFLHPNSINKSSYLRKPITEIGSKF